MQYNEEEALQDDINAVLLQLSDKQGLWFRYHDEKTSRILFIQQKQTSLDVIKYLYLHTLGVKCSHYPSLNEFFEQQEYQELKGVIQAEKDKEIFVVEFDKDSLRAFKEKNHFSEKVKEQLRDSNDDYSVIMKVLSEFCQQVKCDIIPSGFIFSCEGSRAKMSLLETLSVIFDALDFKGYRIQVSYLRERCTNTKIAFHIEFLSFFEEAFSRHLKFMEIENRSVHAKITKAIDDFMNRLKSGDVNAFRFIANTPVKSEKDVAVVRSYIDKQEGLEPEDANNKQNELVLENLGQPTQDKKIILDFFREESVLLGFIRLFLNEALSGVFTRCDVVSNTPIIRFFGSDLKTNLLKDYIRSYQPLVPSSESKEMTFTFNLETVVCQVSEEMFSERNAQQYRLCVEAFVVGVVSVFSGELSRPIDARLDTDLFRADLHFEDATKMKFAQVFFNYLNRRYPQLCFSSTVKSRTNTLTLDVTVAKGVLKNQRGLFESAEFPRMLNDKVYILNVLKNMFLSSKKYIKKNISSDEIGADFKKAAKVALQVLIRLNKLSEVKTFFEYNEWDISEPLSGKMDALSYAESLGNVDAVYKYLLDLYFDNQRKNAGISMAEIEAASKADSLDVDLLNRMFRASSASGDNKPLIPTAISATPAQKSRKIKKTAVDLSSVNFLISFCQKANMPHAWQYMAIEEDGQVRLTHQSELGVGLLCDFFQQGRLKYNLQENVLSIAFSDLKNWHAGLSSVKELEETAESIKNRLEILENLLSIIRPIIGISNWQMTNSGLECRFREQTKSESENLYTAKRRNALILLEWVQLKCGFQENAIIFSDTMGGSSLQITLAALKQKEWLKLRDKSNFLSTDRPLLKWARILASTIRFLESPLSNCAAVDEILTAEITKLAKAKQTQSFMPLEEAPKKRVKETPKQEKKPKEAKSTGKKKKVLTVKTPAPAITHSTKTKAKKRAGPVLPPQNEQHFMPVENIRATPHQDISVPAGSGIDLGQYMPKQQASKDNMAPESPSLLPKHITLEESEIIQHLEEWIKKIQQLIGHYQNYCKTQKLNDLSDLTTAQQEEILEFTAAWHYLHSEVASILATLSDDHPAKKQIFNHPLYKGERTYDRQKHVHFPPVETLPIVPFQRCLINVDAMLAAITLLSADYSPLDQSKALVKDIIQGWSSYLENDFENYNIVKLTENMGIEQFLKWIHARVKAYSAQIKKYSAKDNFASEFAALFYLIRVGELVGHIPKFARTPYLQFCRKFRNAAVHAYNRRISVFEYSKPLLDKEKLKSLLELGASPRFFSQKPENFACELYVNKSYPYQSVDILLLSQLRLQTLGASVPLLTCDLVNLSPSKNLYSALGKKCDELNKSMGPMNNAIGILFVPFDCYHSNADFQEQEALRCVAALKFVRQYENEKSDIVLKEICYANIFGFNATIKSCMDAVPDNWSKNSPAKNRPVVKSIEPIVLREEHKASSGVLQVELFVQLAERRLIADKLLDPKLQTRLPLAKKKTKSPEEKSRQIGGMLFQLRSEHLKLPWENNRHDFYFKQQLLKEESTEIRDEQIIDREQCAENCLN